MATSGDFETSQTDDTLNLQKTSLSRSKFNEIIKQPPSEVLCFILENKTDFISLLKEKDTDKDLICCAVITLGLACTDETYPRRNLNELMIFLSSVMDLIAVNLQRWLVSLHKQNNHEKLHFDALLHLTMFLKEFQLTLPSSSFDSVSIMLPLLIQTSEKCLRDQEELYKTVSEMLSDISAEKNRFFEHYTIFDIKRESEKEKLQLQEPPESYRSLSILPTVDDIESPCSFLRPSIAKGKYKDTEHYLDVQFRLLREDFIKPLRDGIAEYLSIKKQKLPLRSSKNMKVYNNVCINSELFVDGDLLHVLQFSDAYFTEINWESSKRLMYGNLLCLSTNDFHSMLFAIVVKREVKELEKGLITVKFEGLNEAVINLNLSDSFVVIETSTLFESYRHNLNVLQLLSEESLSMKRYIVDVEKKVNKPQYLLSTTEYDMTPLLLPLNEKIRSTEKLTMRDHYKYKFTTVLQDYAWPSATELDLNESQYLALKLAITKEFSIIQGPPGTGKTYVGLRAVQLLLHNIRIWFNDRTNALPILIVCYTNHALDQFLVEISKFTKQIARIGGRISNPEIEEYSIKKLKKTYGTNVPEECWLKKSKAEDKSVKIKKEINEINSYIENSTKSLLSEHVLKDNMTEIQYKSFSYPPRNAVGISHNLKDREFSHIYDWLQFGILEESFAGKKSDSTDSAKRKAVVRTNGEVDSEGEADIEFTVNQRNVDYYDFENAHVLRKKLPDERTAECSEQAWEFQNKNKRKFTAHIRESLRQNRAMPLHRVKRITNVWTLGINERWQLYKFWLECFIEKKRKQHDYLQNKLSVAMKELANARVEIDLALLEHIDVLGMTTTGAAKYRHILDARNPVILIVEEAAEILECHIITSLTPKTQHVILIGDQQQLRPSPTVYMLAVKYGMNVSLFERMIKNGMDYCKLTIQHRMRPEIASLIVPHIYPNLKNHKTVTKFQNVRGVSKNVFFVNHNFEELAVQDSKSKVNEHEARFLLKLCNYLLLQGYESSRITILTTYSGQLFAIKKLARGEVKEVRCTVVDNFQGEENDIILISFVRSNNEGEVGFLKVSNRICVALSRAKIGLYCIGNFELFSQKSKLWKNITQTLSEANSIGQVLHLTCQNHPDIINEVKSDKDFDCCPDGGCNRKCNYRLRCGHSCVLFCHPYDMEHQNIECRKPCIESCVNEHPCKKKCFEDCHPCETLMDRVLTNCGHTENAPCGMEEDEIKCNNPCNKICKNDHACPKRCFECSGFCEVLIDRLLSRCGHTVNAKCGELETKIKCENPCKKTCDKGHPCSRTCSECFLKMTDRFSFRCRLDRQSNHNQICKVLIDRKLSRCGHTVNTECGKSEHEIECGNPCNKSCENGHQCTKKCFELCVCKIPVDKICDVCGSSDQFPCNEISHAKCQRPCTKKCSRDHSCQKMCFEICYCETLIEKTLKCSHKVMAKCGESEYLIKCMSQCEKILSCQHRCRKKCSEQCATECFEIIEIKSPICGHNVKIQCRMKNNSASLIRNCTELCEKILPCDHACKGYCRCCRKIGSHAKCNEVCKRKLPCGHECTRRCNDSCEVKCMQITDIYLSGCGHSIKDECFMRNNLEELSKKCPELCKEVLSCGHTCEGTCGTCKQGKSHIKCTKICNKKLKCLHGCVNICSEPCTAECMQFTEVQSTVCQHFVEIECCFSCNSDKLSLKCCEPCMEILPCGHTCKGSCGKCYQGRLHIACKETCEKILICGHKCESKCFKSCPPCEKPCENRCFHGKCRKKCGDPCGKCNKPCAWRCRHKKCNRRCNEICDREPCNEPCLKVMTCKHPCVGFCGEPCPKECFMCDIESNQCSNEVPKNNSVGYIYLEDCNHLVQENELNEFLTSGLIEQLEIRLKKCPTCGTIIRNNFRYSKIIKKCLAEVEIVKQLNKRNRYHNLKFQNNLLGMAKSASGNKSVLFKRMTEVLSSNYIRDIHELTNLESVISIAIEIEWKTYSAFASNADLETLIDYILSCRKRLSVFILDNFISISEFQLFQLTREAHRINLLDFMLKFANKMQLTSMSPEFETCLKCLMTSKSFTDGSIKNFETTFKNFSDRFPNESGDVPKSNFILKVMNLSGYWYFCPKKHVNCITGNIEASQEICFECDKNMVKKEKGQKVSQENADIDVKESHEFGNQQCLKKMSESSKSNMKDLKNRKESYQTNLDRSHANNKSIPNNSRTTENIKFTDEFQANWRRNDRSNSLPHHFPPQKSFSKKSGRQNPNVLERRKNGSFEGKSEDNFLGYSSQNTKQRQPEFFSKRRENTGRGRGNNRSSSVNENASDCGRSSFARRDITGSSQQLSSSEQVNKDASFETNSQRSNNENYKPSQPGFFNERTANTGRGRGRGRGYHQRHKFC